MAFPHRLPGLRSLASPAVLLAAVLLPACNGFGGGDGMDPAVTADLRVVSPDARAVGRIAPASAMADLRAFALAVDPDLADRMDSLDRRLREMTADAPFDPLHDLQSVVGYAAGPDAMVMVGRGTFDAAGLASAVDAAMPDSARRIREGDLSAWVLQGPRRAMAGGVLAPGHLVGATGEEALRSAVQRLSGAATGPPAEWLPLIEVVAEAPAWLVVRDLPEVGVPADAPGNLATLAAGIARAVRHLAVEGRVEAETATGSVVLWPKEGVDPDDLADLVEGAFAAVLLSPELPEPMRASIEDIEVRAGSDHVRIRAAVTAATVRALVDL